MDVQDHDGFFSKYVQYRKSAASGMQRLALAIKSNDVVVITNLPERYGMDEHSRRAISLDDLMAAVQAGKNYKQYFNLTNG